MSRGLGDVYKRQIYIRGMKCGTLKEGNFWFDKVYKIEYIPAMNGIAIKIDGEVEVA